jgi:CheY-like chemotaxis protein
MKRVIILLTIDNKEIYKMTNDVLKILIIDDDKQNAELLCMLLSRLGYNAKYGADPYFGIELLKKFKPLVVFIDIKMPKMNGYDVANYIRNSEEFKNTILRWSRLSEQLPAKVKWISAGLH